jgi:small subunit ribosomal protein S4e
MASHGKSRHVKSLAAPIAQTISRKATKFVAKPLPGTHKLKESIALVALLRDVLKIVDMARQAQALLKKGAVTVDGRPAKDLRQPIGLMDVVAIPTVKKAWRIVLVKRKLVPKEVRETEASSKLCKIVGKTSLAKGKIQLGLHDGRSYVISQEEDRFSLGDTIKLTLFPEQRLAEFFKLEPGAKCYVSHGKHSGKTATLKELIERPGSFATEAKLEREGQELITLKDYLFAVPKDFEEPYPKKA